MHGMCHLCRVFQQPARTLLKQFAETAQKITTITANDQEAALIIRLFILPFLNETLNYQQNQNHYKMVDDHHQTLPEEDGSFVYLLFDRATKLLKIGTTVNIKRRIRTLRTSSPSGKNIVLLAYCAGTAKEEKHFHDRFMHLRLHGEWFKPHTDITDFFRKLTAANNGRFNTSYIEKYVAHFNK
jgi:hypothetical protein